MAQSDFYFLGAFGKSDADVDAGVYGARLKRIRGNEQSFALGAGYEFAENFSMELAYQDFGASTGNRNECAQEVCTLEAYDQEAVDITAIAISAIGAFRINEGLSGYGKIGLTSSEFDSASSVYDSSARDWHFGAGLRWSMNDDWAIFAEYDWVGIDIQSVAVGIKYGF